MKKLNLIFNSIICAFICCSCDITNIFARKEKIESYSVFQIYGELESYDVEEYLGVKNKETKVFSNLEDLSSFNSLLEHIDEKIRDDVKEYAGNIEIEGEKLTKDIDFGKNNVYVTPIIDGHSKASFSVKEIYKKGNIITQKITQDVYIPAIGPGSYGFVYVVAEKGIEFKTSINVNKHYNPSANYKPVLYLYNKEELDVEVKYQNDYLLKTTYPEYEDGWRVHINENGTLNINDSQREYYAIFYDEYRNFEATFDYGFNVSKDNAIEFLETSLDTLGYTQREADEFIMFWLPILEENEHSLVYFEQTDERNEECPLSFSITPDSVLRTIIHIKKVNAPQEIIPQELETVHRTGFSVVEWGGTTY